jgi:hypothetical protein
MHPHAPAAPRQRACRGQAGEAGAYDLGVSLRRYLMNSLV